MIHKDKNNTAPTVPFVLSQAIQWHRPFPPGTANNPGNASPPVPG
jgi:hypothetical protein